VESSQSNQSTTELTTNDASKMFHVGTFQQPLG